MGILDAAAAEKRKLFWVLAAFDDGFVPWDEWWWWWWWIWYKYMDGLDLSVEWWIVVRFEQIAYWMKPHNQGLIVIALDNW